MLVVINCKKTKNMKKIMLFLSFLIVIGFYSCNEDEKSKNETENSDFSVHARGATDSIDQAYKIVYEDRVLEVTLEKRQNDYKNKFSYKVNEELLFSLQYSFNNGEEGWKYDEQAKAIAFANELKELNLEQSELETLKRMLFEGYNELFFYVDENNYNEDLFSILAYLDSAVSSNLRMREAGAGEIEGTISPSFLVEKSHFIFMEDFNVNLDLLRDNIDLLKEEAINTGLEQDMNMVNFIKTTPKSSVTFDKLYSFYASKIDFKQHIAEKAIFKAGDCKESCVIGCGSDWGCCGNYKGCCYYSSSLCLAHDLLCTDCGHWTCGWGCVPDGPEGNRVVKIIMGAV